MRAAPARRADGAAGMRFARLRRRRLDPAVIAVRGAIGCFVRLLRLVRSKRQPQHQRGERDLCRGDDEEQQPRRHLCRCYYPAVGTRRRGIGAGPTRVSPTVQAASILVIVYIT